MGKLFKYRLNYKNASIYLERKYEKFHRFMKTEKKLRFCSIEGCENIHKGKNLCSSHYEKIVRNPKRRKGVTNA